MKTWHNVVNSDTPISQGDIFLDLSIPLISDTARIRDYKFNLEEFFEQDGDLELDIVTSNMIVMTQACDLERTPPENIILCGMKSVEELGLSKTKTKEVLSYAISGKNPNHAIIGPYSGNETDLNMSYQLIDFTQLYTLPYNYLSDFSKQYMNGKRLRVNTPHRELVNQKFGHFFSRIGIPNSDHLDADKIMRELFPKQQ